jgi:hypothetical protein
MDAEGQSRQGMDIPSLSLFKFVSGFRLSWTCASCLAPMEVEESVEGV